MSPFCSSLGIQPALRAGQHDVAQVVHFRAVIVPGQMPEPVGQQAEAMFPDVLPVEQGFSVQRVDGKDETAELDRGVAVPGSARLSVPRFDEGFVQGKR